MDLQIKNFASIASADVKFDGLTVIAGENDTGKSTVGKLVFSVIKAISKYEQDLGAGKEQSIGRLVENLYLKLRRSSGPRAKNYQDIIAEFRPNNFSKQLRPLTTDSLSLFQEYEDKLNNEEIDLLFNKKKGVIENIEISEQSRYTKDELIKDLNKIKTDLNRKENKSEVLKRALKRAFVSEFHLEFTPQNTQRKTLINFNEGENKLFEINAKKNTIDSFEIYDDIPPFEDVTFVESPIIIQLHDAISSARTLLEIKPEDTKTISMSGNVTLHIKDLMNKIKVSDDLAKLYEGQQQDILKEIEDIIQGNWSYDNKRRDFIFSKKSEEQQIRSTNTASGIKSFGIIQLLLLAEVINSRTLLIIDEPETHLHPKWQVEYAKIIVLLVKNEIPVLVTSHSPYMIEALRYFSEKFGVEKLTNYYLAERNKNGLVDIENVNDDLNRIFLKLSEPFQKLIWEG